MTHFEIVQQFHHRDERNLVIIQVTDLVFGGNMAMKVATMELVQTMRLNIQLL